MKRPSGESSDIKLAAPSVTIFQPMRSLGLPPSNANTFSFESMIGMVSLFEELAGVVWFSKIKDVLPEPTNIRKARRTSETINVLLGIGMRAKTVGQRGHLGTNFRRLRAILSLFLADPGLLGAREFGGVDIDLQDIPFGGLATFEMDGFERRVGRLCSLPLPLLLLPPL